jgi:hypothetical protein
MSNFAVNLYTIHLHLLDGRQISDRYTIEIREKLIAYSPNEFKSPKSNYSKG